MRSQLNPYLGKNIPCRTTSVYVCRSVFGILGLPRGRGFRRHTKCAVLSALLLANVSNVSGKPVGN